VTHPKMAGMTDPTQMAGQPSPEQMRAYLEQLRESDAAGLLAEAFNLLATGAQVKLGRSDARALIDALAGMVQGAGPALPPQIAEQMQQGIGQLQLAQVEAEREATQQAAGDQAGDAGDAGTTEESATGAASGPTMSSPPGQGSAADQRMTDRLWVPGRGPRPPGV
jgi:hypothetical protein